ncbi:MAG: hypothetical protein ACI9ON_001820 [Limisphaerales bacterium]
MATHVFEIAPSGRSKCRGCGEKIDKQTLRFGERLPNPFGDGEMTHWHHPACAAQRRPASLLETLIDYPQQDDPENDKATLMEDADNAVSNPRLQRLGNIEQASSGRARCRHCNDLVTMGDWRLPLIYFTDDAYNSSGFIHLTCAKEYCETHKVWRTIACFAKSLDEQSIAEIEAIVQR